MKLKQLPEDFCVKEVININTIENGDYCYYTLRKINRDSFSVFNELSTIFNVRSKDIGFAGVKDKRAVTEQFISVFKPRKFFEKFDGNGFQLVFYGRGKEKESKKFR